MHPGRPTPGPAADAIASLLVLVGVIGGIASAVLAGLGVAASSLFLVGCAATYRGLFLETNVPPVDCLAGPAWPLVWWFTLVGAGAVLTFSTLVIGAYRPRWSVPAGVLLAVVTTVSAVLTSPAGGA